MALVGRAAAQPSSSYPSPSPPPPSIPDGASPQPARRLTAAEVVRDVQLTDEESTFYVCPPATGVTVVRLEPPRQCPDARVGRRWTEGISVIFKENISPYKFKATLYYKNVIQTVTWSGATYRQITSRDVDRTPVSVQEITDLIDASARCSSRAAYLRNNVQVEAFDRDEAARDVRLTPSRYSTPESRAWHTTNDTYTVFGSPWLYRSGTSVNCIVEEVGARSVFPYSSFALANGDYVDASPFYGFSPKEAADEHMGYARERFMQLDGYLRMDLDTGEKVAAPARRNFLSLPQFTVAWNWEPKARRVCSMAKWREVEEMLRADYPGGRVRFSARELSAIFVANNTAFDPDTVLLGQCVRADAKSAIDAIFARRYAESHVRSGDVQFSLAVGGFVVAFQPIISKSLANMYLRELIRENRTDDVLDLLRRQREAVGGSDVDASATATEPPLAFPAARARRAADDASSAVPVNDSVIIKTTSSAQFAMLQFAYDHIQAHVNEMFSRIARAWCELQNREVTLWTEAIKLNPSHIASVTLGRRVAARRLGDVTAVSSCLKIDRDSVVLQNSMRIATSTSTCYSRPLVLFSYTPRGDKVSGQLGERNELVPTLDMVEPCVAEHRRYFLFGDKYVYFENYLFVRTVEPADVQVMSTFVELNLTMLEDREILPLTVYTKEELRDTGLLDYAEVVRRNALHDLKFYDIDKVIEVDTQHAFMQGLTELFNGLGSAGRAIGKVVVGAAGAIVSTVSGIASFIANPFGALAIGLVVVAAIVAAFLAYRYINKLRSNPMKALYPITTRDLKTKGKNGGGGGGGGDDGDEEEDFDEEKLEQAREMVKYMALLSAEERQRRKLDKKRNGTSAFLQRRLEDLRARRRRRGAGGRGYDRLEEDYDPYEDGPYVGEFRAADSSV